MRTALASLAFLATAIPSPAQPQDWSETARTDLAALHELIQANHPGPANSLDPEFSARSDAALKLALGRADAALDYPGYLAALNGYIASFDDGHVAIQWLKPIPVEVRWPGFLTAYDSQGRQVVRTRLSDAPLPLGATLIECDGRSADELGREIVGDFRGRWMLASQRASEGFRIFINNGNPFVRHPERCTFDVEGKTQVVSISWTPMSDEDWDSHAVPLAAPARPLIEARTLEDGTRWYAMSSFNGSPEGETAKALVPLIADMKRDRQAVVTAPRIVLDLRGNGGGSSDWSRQIAAILWGEAAIEQLDIGSDAVEWRASAANAAMLAKYRDEFGSAADVAPAVKRYFELAASGIAAAHAAGEPLWREPDGLYQDPAPSSDGETVESPQAPVFVLTDWTCASACLDAVDLWRALGAIQIGRETSADTLYMDIRRETLPSGLSRAAIPMKVYRGRARGANVPWEPVHRFEGDMADQAALEAWIAGLPSQEITPR